MASSTILYGSEIKPIDWKPQRTAKWKPDEIGKSLGLTYDANVLESKFNNATKAEYEALKGEYANTENAYYRNMYNTQNSSIDAIRKANASAVATGASRGMQAANELSSILGLQQTSQEGATELANARNDLYTKEQAAYKQNVLDAIKQANETGLALGNLNANLYASDTQFDVGQMDYYAQLEQAMKSLMAAQEQAEANRYGADQNLAGVRYQADASVRAAEASRPIYNYSYGSNSGGSGGSGGGSTSTAKAKAGDPGPILEATKGKYISPGDTSKYTSKSSSSTAKKTTTKIPDKKGQNASNRFTSKTSGRKR